MRKYREEGRRGRGRATHGSVTPVAQVTEHRPQPELEAGDCDIRSYQMPPFIRRHKLLGKAGVHVYQVYIYGHSMCPNHLRNADCPKFYRHQNNNSSLVVMVVGEECDRSALQEPLPLGPHAWYRCLDQECSMKCRIEGHGGATNKTTVPEYLRHDSETKYDLRSPWFRLLPGEIQFYKHVRMPETMPVNYRFHKKPLRQLFQSCTKQQRRDMLAQSTCVPTGSAAMPTPPP